jgi:hypothetical protein
LRWLRPRILYLVDESGSGQPLVRAARELGIRSIGIQHGDFPTSAQYAPSGQGSFAVEPVDLLCVWSEWFRERLLAVSPIYHRHNTAVTGRLRWPAILAATTAAAAARTTRVLVIGARGATARAALQPFVDSLAAAGAEFAVRLRPHPAEANGSLPSLGDSLQVCDVVVGSASSALLEAIYWQRPVITCGNTEVAAAEAQLAIPCADPAQLQHLVRSLASTAGTVRAEEAYRIVWSGCPENPVEAILVATGNLADRL